MAERTNAMRLLDQRKIPYEVFEFSPEIHSATEVAAAIGVPEEQVFKTLVVMREKAGARPLLIMIPADRELDLKRVAAALGEKRVRMATQREAESRTGLLVGGISALALLNKGFEIYLDESARALDRIVVSAGRRGLNLRVAVEALVALTRARWIAATGGPAEPA